MAQPYSFTRRSDGAGNTIFAAHINELQQAIETLGIRGGGTFVAGQTYGPASTFPGAWSTSVAMTAGRLYAVPFFTGPNGFTATNLSIEVTTLAAANARLGIYAADTDPPFFPASLLLDAGEVSTGTTGIKTIDITDALYTGTEPSRLIWLASVFQGTPNVRVIQQISHIVGVGAAGVHQSGVYMTHAYAALPSTFDDPPDGAIESVPSLFMVAG